LAKLNFFANKIFAWNGAWFGVAQNLEKVECSYVEVEGFEMAQKQKE